MPKNSVMTVAIVSLFLTSSALAQTVREPGAAVPAAVDAAGKVTESTDFVTRVAYSDIFEIRSSELALEKSQTPEIRSFAEQMIADHKASTEALKTAAAADGIPVEPPPEVDADGAEMMDSLRGAADGFDAVYQRMQIEKHDEAIALFDSFARGGETPALKTFAAGMLPKLLHHREMLPAQAPLNN